MRHPRRARLDPGNARYPYALAALMLGQSAEVRLGETNGVGAHQEYRLIIRDRALLDQAMGEIQKASGKPFYTTYCSKMWEYRT